MTLIIRLNYIPDTMQRYNVHNWETCDLPFKKEAFTAMYIRLCPEKQRKGDKQDLARMRRKIDLVGLIASAATYYAALSDAEGILYPQSSKAVRFELTFNEDGLAVLSKDPMQKSVIRLPKNVLKEMKKQGFSPKCLSSSAEEKMQEIRDKQNILGSSSSSGSSVSSRGSSGIQIREGAIDETTLSHIRRDGFVQRPIITSQKLYAPSKYPPKQRAMQKRGLKIDIISQGTGKWLAAILTFVENLCQPGHYFYQLSEKLFVVIRSKKTNELALAMEKQAKAFIPAMERAREKVIEDWLLNHNNTVDFKTKNQLPDPGQSYLQCL